MTISNRLILGMLFERKALRRVGTNTRFLTEITMHELSIAQSIVETVYNHVPEERRSLVSAITVEVGAASGVVADSLCFAFDALKEQVPFCSAELKIITVPFVVQCDECGKQSQNDACLMICTHCGSIEVTIISGTELIVKQIELADV